MIDILIFGLLALAVIGLSYNRGRASQLKETKANLDTVEKEIVSLARTCDELRDKMTTEAQAAEAARLDWTQKVEALRVDGTQHWPNQ